MFDEVKIKVGIVYDKNEGGIIGFTDLGDVNNTLLKFEGINNKSNVAKEMLVFMVRGLFIKLRLPYAQYPTQGITADYLFPLVWEVVKHLECAGFKVISLNCNYKPKFLLKDEGKPCSSSKLHERYHEPCRNVHSQ